MVSKNGPGAHLQVPTRSAFRNRHYPSQHGRL